MPQMADAAAVMARLRREPLISYEALVPNVRESEISANVTGADADESLASAPLRYGPRVIGAITISKLGIAQFDEDDLRLLEVLAGHASVSLENARLYESLRREAENAKAWLDFSDAVTEARHTLKPSIGERGAHGIPIAHEFVLELRLG